VLDFARVAPSEGGPVPGPDGHDAVRRRGQGGPEGWGGGSRRGHAVAPLGGAWGEAGGGGGEWSVVREEPHEGGLVEGMASFLSESVRSRCPCHLVTRWRLGWPTRASLAEELSLYLCRSPPSTVRAVPAFELHCCRRPPCRRRKEEVLVCERLAAPPTLVASQLPCQQPACALFLAAAAAARPLVSQARRREHSALSQRSSCFASCLLASSIRSWLFPLSDTAKAQYG
jgi:hypothetical protein